MKGMEFGGRGHGGSQQDGPPAGCPSSLYPDPADPPACPYDPSLAGSSSHVSQPQGLGQMSATHSRYPPFPSQSQPSSIPRSGHTCLHQSLDGLQTTYTQAWTDHQVTSTQTTTEMPQPYTSQPCFGGGVFAVVRSRPPALSPFYPINAQIGGVTRPAGHQQDGQYVDNRRSSCPHPHSPTPQQHNYPPLLSPTRSSPSYSPSEAGSAHFERLSPQGVSSAWPHVPYGLHNRHASNPTPSTRPHSAVEPQSQIYSPFLSPSNQPPNPASYAQVPPYLGPVPSDQHNSAYPREAAPSFPEPQLPTQDTRGKRKRETQSSPEPEPQPSKRKRERVPQFGEQPVASSSRVTLDTPSPQGPHPAARGKGRKSDDPAKMKDANRKKEDRKEIRDLFGRIRDFLEMPTTPQVQVLNRVIDHFGGAAVQNTDKPMKSRQYPKKGHSNSVRANNAGARFGAIRNILMERGYRVTCKTSHADVLRVALYEMMRLANTEDPELSSLIYKFLPERPQGA